MTAAEETLMVEIVLALSDAENELDFRTGRAWRTDGRSTGLAERIHDAMMAVPEALYAKVGATR